MNESHDPMKAVLDCALTRRRFLFLGGGAAATLAIGALLPRFPSLGGTGANAVQLDQHPRTLVGSVSSLVEGEPVEFTYPYDSVMNDLIKLGAPAGGGVGPDGDIVAFNTLCTHMGGLMLGSYKPDYKILGPCPVHLTTFDLTRHGMVVAGHATAGLPQIILEVEGDDIYATEVMSLLYGFSDNKLSPQA